MIYRYLIITLFTIFLKLFSYTFPSVELKHVKLENISTEYWKFKSVGWCNYNFHEWYDSYSKGVIVKHITVGWKFSSFQGSEKCVGVCWGNLLNDGRLEDQVEDRIILKWILRLICIEMTLHQSDCGLLWWRWWWTFCFISQIQ